MASYLGHSEGLRRLLPKAVPEGPPAGLSLNVQSVPIPGGAAVWFESQPMHGARRSGPPGTPLPRHRLLGSPTPWFALHPSHISCSGLCSLPPGLSGTAVPCSDARPCPAASPVARRAPAKAPWCSGWAPRASLPSGGGVALLAVGVPARPPLCFPVRWAFRECPPLVTLPALEALGSSPRAGGPPPLFLCVQSCLLGPRFLHSG